MFGSWVLEVAIGLIFVFLLFSTICAALREGIEAWTKTRAAYLERGIRELLHDVRGTGLARTFYEHPLIYSLYAGKYEPGPNGGKPATLARGGELPSYIPAKNFAAAMIDIAARGPLPALDPNDPAAGPATSTADIDIDALRTGIAAMHDKRVARALLNALDLAGNDLNKARLNIEAWFDSGMDRISGWYKRATQKIVFGLALVLAIVLNVDAIGIANFLYQNDHARHAVVAQAEATVANAPEHAAAGDPARRYRLAKAALDDLELPIGWRTDVQCGLAETGTSCAGMWALRVLGWLLVALGATLGAPFWFDILNKVMVIRSTVKPYEKSQPEGSEDRQNTRASTAAATRAP